MIQPTQNEVFLAWIREYDAILWKVARSYAPFGEHEELHQDLLISLWRAAPLYRDQSKPSTFIYRVALNGALNWTRNRQRHQQRHVALDESHRPAAPISGERERRVEQLYAALAMLAGADRSLALLYLDALSYREMAEVLGITESNVGVKVNRMKKRLAEALRQIEHTGKVTAQ